MSEVHNHDHHHSGHSHAKVLRPKSPMEDEPVFWFSSMLLLFVSATFILYFSAYPNVTNFTIYFLAIVLEAFPFLLIGSFVSGLIEVYISQERIAHLMRNRIWAVPVAILLGLLLPVCECAIVPVVRRLVKKGVPLSAAIAYMLASPTFNPLVLTSTAMAFAWDMSYVLGRFGGGVVVAALVAYALGGLLGKRGFARKVFEDGSAHGGACPITSAKGKKFSGKLNAVVGHATHDFFDVTKYLILGAFSRLQCSRRSSTRDALMHITTNEHLSPLPPCSSRSS
ncbi:MAG: permease [Planctomycetota bacterium]|nr:permease [Planctomycetota bacterium]